MFAQALFTRAVDPVIPMIAGDLAIDVKTAALLSSAFTFPYALVQPVLGITADFFGKTRLMNLCLLVAAVAGLVSAVAASFGLLVAMRVVAGVVAGGIFPVAMALIGDLIPVERRQVSIGHLLAVALTGNLVGAALSGVIGDYFGWRGVFAILGLRSLYFALAGLMEAFQFLHYGLSTILMFIGVKMLISGYYSIPTGIALGVVASVLVVSIVASIAIKPKTIG